jgi:NADH-quinone oxidoreductase subunit N
MHFLPELILLALALLVLTYDFVKLTPARRVLAYLSLGGLLASFAALFLPYLTESTRMGSFFSGLYLIDNFSLVFKGLFLLAGALIILLNFDFFASAVKKHEGEFYFLFLTSILGLMIMVSSPNLLMIYLGMETVSFTSYLLTGWQKTVKRSSEAALKYFLFGALASAIFLFGVSYFYGLTGTLDLGRAGGLNIISPLGFLSLLLILFGLGFKIAMVPMQFWCPDVYEGAPTSITAYLSVAPKAAGFAVILRLLTLLNIDIVMLLALLSAVTMTLGNFAALRQRNIKRLLAYSSIAQAGYILIGLVSPEIGYSAVIFYLIVYTFANLGAFAAVIYLAEKLGSEDIESYAGFARRSPMIALAFAVFFLSLIGIPPLAGFIGKFLLFKAAVGSGYLWLAIVGVVNSVVSVYYYMNVMQIIYFRTGDESQVKIPAFIFAAVWLCLVVVVVLGVFPNILL